MRAIIGHNLIDFIEMIGVVSYAYDDIGNRITAEGKTYTANSLNQYTAIDDFTPQYDADGNQTLIQTETGIWQVTYNAENRPVRWVSGDTVIEMAFDCMGRRTLYKETTGGEVVSNKRFLYRDYLCIAELDAATLAITQSFVWDPTEPIATRPLKFQIPQQGDDLLYMHDGNKNISDLIPFNLSEKGAEHCNYTPFGLALVSSDSSVCDINPYLFSSEWHDKCIGLIAYSSRSFNLLTGRWSQQDFIDESASNSYLFCYNNPIAYVDFLGGVSLQFSWSAPIPPIPFSVIGASIIPDLSFRGQFSECRLCNGTIPEIHSYAEGEVSLSFGLQWGLSRKDGINSRGQYVYESGKYPNGNTRYRDLSGRFAKAPSTDLLGELLGLHLEEQDFIPATMEDWATLPICPDNHWEGSISAYVRGQATVLGVGASMNFVWQILPDGALIPDFEGRRGYVGGGTALYAEIGVTGSLRFTTLW